jgi:hypothetical protein
MNPRFFYTLFFCVLSLVLFGHTANAQGLQTGTITGIVSSQDAAPLPGVTVTATSPALQEARESVSDVNGVYYLRALPPGTYTVQFTLAGFQSALREAVAVTLGGTADIHATLPIATQTELVTVTGPSAGGRPISRSSRRDSPPTRSTPASWRSAAPSATTTCSW